MPAMNTWQFNWVKNRLPNKTQPVPPIYDPEVTALVVLAAGYAERPRREYWVCAPTVGAILGQKFIPGLLDRYLGKTGYDSQQIPSEPRDPSEQDNLNAFVPGPHSARGKFGNTSTQTSIEVFVGLHRHWFFAGAAALLGAGATLLATKKKRSWF